MGGVCVVMFAPSFGNSGQCVCIFVCVSACLCGENEARIEQERKIILHVLTSWNKSIDTLMNRQYVGLETQHRLSNCVWQWFSFSDKIKTINAPELSQNVVTEHAHELIGFVSCILRDMTCAHNTTQWFDPSK